jgi:predicted Rossmann-fold nucleotide-binding protein
MDRKIIIGIMGGDESVGAVALEAAHVGAAVTRAHCILLTGGCGIDTANVIETTPVKDAAMHGAKEQESDPQTIARLLGILPDGPRSWEPTQRTLFLKTGLGSVERDPITGVTPDALIFFAGGTGTLCELAFALQAKRPVLCWNAAQKLNAKYQYHTKVDQKLDKVLATGLCSCKTKLISVEGVGEDTTVSMLRDTLGRYLECVQDSIGNYDDIVREVCRRVGKPKKQTGFPGFRDESCSKQRFEEIVRTISA